MEMCSAIVAKPRHLAVGQPVIAQLQRADQRAMHDQVGIAADRRGEVGVFRQVQAEMADIVGVVDRLRLAAQHHVVHHRSRAAVPLAFGQNAVEGARLHHLALGEADAEGAQEVGEGEQLLLRRRRRARGRSAGVRRFLQRLGGRDIGQHHELLDQPHGFQPLADRRWRRSCRRRRASMRRSGRSRSSGSRASRAMVSDL